MKTKLLASVLLPILFACSSMEVQTSKDPQADLSQYRTYAWAQQPRGRPTSILDQTLKTSVEQRLAAKGLKPAKDSQPDLLVSYYGASRDMLNYYPAPYFGYPTYPYYGTNYVTREGSLTLQFIDPKSKRIVWQGTATDVIGDTGATPDQVTAAVDELFKRFPQA